MWPKITTFVLLRGSNKPKLHSPYILVTMVNPTRTNMPSEFMNSDKTALVFAYTSWCDPSKLMLPIISSLKKRDIDIILLDIDNEPQEASKLNLKATPTLLAVNKGRVTEKLVGAHSLKDCIDFCSSIKK